MSNVFAVLRYLGIVSQTATQLAVVYADPTHSPERDAVDGIGVILDNAEPLIAEHNAKIKTEIDDLIVHLKGAAQDWLAAHDKLQTTVAPTTPLPPSTSTP